MDWEKLLRPIVILLWPPENGIDPALTRTWRRWVGVSCAAGLMTGIAFATSHIPPGWSAVGLGRVAWASDLETLKRDVEETEDKKVDIALQASTKSNNDVHHILSDMQATLKQQQGATAASKIRTTQREMCHAAKRYERKRLQDELDEEGRVYFDAMGREFNFTTLACGKAE